ncbi:hypothetical protein METHB2_180022 [Candidatus Methylobacter favarea]|uniref:Uncharacterized protein n=1 Tax=Candidatus Methylobacter favarea TaxID=2707345 RepID=A0A8S0WHU3_9GAMM|nr:hypothetical protein METHB2_180022 [Candidatus Methylobacter favarea]
MPQGAPSHYKNPANLSENMKCIDLAHSYDSAILYWPNNKKGVEHINYLIKRQPVHRKL